jgi:hypothetical protein
MEMITTLLGGMKMKQKENPYFAEAGAPITEQEDNDKSEQSGSYPQGNNDDDDVQIESEEIGLKKGDITLY